MLRRLSNVQEVAAWRLCVGCGACAAACDHNAIQLIDIEGDGIRPVVDERRCVACGSCMAVCPGIGISHPQKHPEQPLIKSLFAGFGPVLQLWEGHACDEQMRYCGSSGGVVNALAHYCIDHREAQGVLHVGPHDKRPWANTSCISNCAQQLLMRTGSRYAPASPCDRLRTLEQSDGPRLFIGKPCDIHALRKSAALRPRLAARLDCAISIFCAGTPSTRATLDLIQALAIDANQISAFRFRGRGWPGHVAFQRGQQEPFEQSWGYEKAWSFLQRYRPVRCYLCPDGCGEFADISCGDPWYRSSGAEEPGRSLILVRTQRGAEIVQGASKEGYIAILPATTQQLLLSQPNLLRKRAALWGRLATMRMLGVPAPQLGGFSLFENWLQLCTKEKLRSIGSTLKRIMQRGYHAPQPIRAMAQDSQH
jgi:coenzyme F420 hydrogenase subunit beta